MRAVEVKDAGTLAGASAEEIVTLARDVHRAWSDQVFRLLGPVGAPVRLVHDRVADAAYRGAALAVRSVPVAAGAAAATYRVEDGHSLHDGRRAAGVLSAVNAWFGDRLAAADDALAVPLRVRTSGHPLRRHTGNVVHDVGTAATGRIVLFLHGLGESDRCWSLGTEAAFGDRHTDYGTLLADDGWTPLYACFNSGRHISETGADVSDLLDGLQARWPVPVEQVAIVGHSMGGLIARSAALSAVERGQSWVEHLTDLVLLGTPNSGAPLELFANLGTTLLGALPQSRPFARWINRRSVGIKDLRYGSVVLADHGDPETVDRFWHNTCTDPAAPPGVRHARVSATLSRNPTGPAALAGDLLVTHVSAMGTHRRRTLNFEPDRVLHLGGRHHFNLLADREAAAALRTWLAESRAEAEGEGVPGTS